MARKVFKDFADFWSHTKTFTTKQRRAILRSMSQRDREVIDSSYLDHGWEDFFMRNKVDGVLDDIAKKYEVDLIELRIAVCKNRKDVYVDKSFWDDVNEKFRGYSERHTRFIFGGYRAVPVEDTETEYLLIRTEKE
jgi:hypothetical protein